MRLGVKYHIRKSIVLLTIAIAMVLFMPIIAMADDALDESETEASIESEDVLIDTDGDGIRESISESIDNDIESDDAMENGEAIENEEESEMAELEEEASDETYPDSELDPSENDSSIDSDKTTDETQSDAQDEPQEEAKVETQDEARDEAEKIAAVTAVATSTPEAAPKVAATAEASTAASKPASTAASTSISTSTSTSNSASASTMSIQEASENLDQYDIRIVRISGGNVYTTSIDVAKALKKHLGVDKFTDIVLARGDRYPDAISGSIICTQKNAPMLLIDNQHADMIIKYIESNLAAKGNIYILGSDKAVSTDIENRLKKFNVKRIAGSNKYNTNIEILKFAKANKYKEWAVISVNSYADGVSVSSAGVPILLTGDSLTKNQKEYLGKQTNKTYSIIGGESAVNMTVEKQLKKYGQVNRDAAGASKYSTSIKVANKFYKGNKKKVVLASGNNLKNSFMAGAYASVMKVPLILTAPDKAAYAYNYVVNNKIQRVTIVGNSTKVPVETVGRTQDPGELYIDGNRYLIKTDGSMAQNEWYRRNNMSYHALSTGIIDKTKLLSGALGIDISEFQKKIDWAKVKAAGIDFAMIRVGGRFYKAGTIYADSMFDLNMKNAIAAGIKVGVYFFSQAITVKEAKEEANYTISKIKKYNVTMPVVIDTEFDNSNYRLSTISSNLRTKCTKAFMEVVENAGYTPMFYCGSYYLKERLIESELSKYQMWLAQWTDNPSCSRDFAMWQYTSSGKVNGINGNVDMNIWYGKTK